jgi:predicted MPP superfamily phosphohydrolase
MLTRLSLTKSVKRILNYKYISMTALTSVSNTIKIFPISDLHLEFYPKELAVNNVINKIKEISEPHDLHLPIADVLVLAGDICDPIEKSDIYIELLKEFKKTYKHIILVPGNHEYYKIKNYDRGSAYTKLKEICQISGTILLEKDSVIINRIKFIGTTLWSKADLSILTMLADFGRVFRNVREYVEEHELSYEWLSHELDDQTDSELYDQIVVITHHLPSFELNHPRFSKYGILNTAFSTDIISHLQVNKIKYWICGHTHESCVKNIKGIDGEVKCIINPLGYPKELKLTKTSLNTYDI